MKVMNVSYDDHANFAFANCEALKAAGVDCTSVKRIKHPFAYKKTSRIVPAEQMRTLIEQADIVQIMHSYGDILETCAELKKKCVVYHTGTAYRIRPEEVNALFNPVVSVSFTDECEFIGTGMKNEVYVATAVDTEEIKMQMKKVTLPYIIAHYPSNPSVKGTDDIKNFMAQIAEDKKWRFNFLCDTSKVPHDAQLKRMAECDIYIELFKPLLYGKPYGCWGVTAFEAAAMGKVVITNNIHADAYQKFYGWHEIVIANTEEEFIAAIEHLLMLSSEQLRKRMTDARTWIEEKHSYLATGKRIKKILEQL